MAVLLADRFVVEQKIGDGTFAEVWRGVDTQGAAQVSGEGRHVALKIFRPIIGEGADRSWDPVYREVAAGLRIPRHPNVVRSWALLNVRFFRPHETPCLVMDFVEGTNLALWLAGQPLPGVDSIVPRLAVMGGLLRGLAHAHAHGVVHQDLSFGNVLVRDGSPPDALLADFGCAATEEPEAPGRLAGDEGEGEMLQPINPPPYALRLPLADSARRDVYAFATLCYLALVGRHPLSDCWQSMRGGHWAGPASPHRALPRRPMIELGPWLGRLPGLAALADLLLRCVAADPSGRPASAQAVQAEWDSIIPAADLVQRRPQG